MIFHREYNIRCIKMVSLDDRYRECHQHEGGCDIDLTIANDQFPLQALRFKHRRLTALNTMTAVT